MLPAASSNGTVLVTGASSGIGEELAAAYKVLPRRLLLPILARSHPALKKG